MFHSFYVTVIFVRYSVDPRLSEKHYFISVAFSGGSNHNLTGLQCSHCVQVENRRISFGLYIGCGGYQHSLNRLNLRHDYDKVNDHFVMPIAYDNVSETEIKCATSYCFTVNTEFIRLVISYECLCRWVMVCLTE